MPGMSTSQARDLVVDACRRYGDRAIVALAGVPGTGKSFIAEQAAEIVAADPLRVRVCQFHPSYSYEEFIEGLRPDPTTGVAFYPGMLFEWSDQAALDPDNVYVLLIDELTRADLSSVLGEIFTYIEYRDRSFLPLYSRLPRRVAPNLVVLATYNPLDKNALTMDAALIRRLRILSFLPSTSQLTEMLTSNGLASSVIDALAKMFDECERKFDNYGSLMPFGHGIFADVTDETPDLHDLWHERIVHLVRPPAASAHPFVDTIEANYPWRQSPRYTLGSGPTPGGGIGPDVDAASQTVAGFSPAGGSPVEVGGGASEVEAAEAGGSYTPATESTERQMTGEPGPEPDAGEPSSEIANDTPEAGG